MMAGNPSWWSSMHIPPSQQPSPSLLSSQYHHHLLGGSSSPSQLPLNSLADHHHNQEVLLPQSWSQLLLGGLPIGDEDRFFPSQYDINYQPKKLENWEDYQTLINQSSSSRIGYVVDHVKQEALPQNSCNLFDHHGNNIIIGGDLDQFHHQTPNPVAWSQQIIAVNSSSPRSCVTSLSSNILDFSYNAEAADHTNNNNNNIQHNHPDHHSSSECNSTATTGGVCKKARVQASTSQPPLKVRKEKLGDRITSLHQLVSPFGKTDTASVLLEAIGYIRFLQSQIEALSSPYLGTSSPNIRNNNQQFMLNDNCLKRKGGPNQEIQENAMDLRSRGLCLVPVSCTQQVGSDINGSDYWAPAAAAFGGGFC